MENLPDLQLTWGSITFAVTLILAFLFLRSGTVKQLIENLKQLGGSQEALLKFKEKELEEKVKEIVKLEATIGRMALELDDVNRENKRLRDYDFQNRQELNEYRLRKMVEERGGKPDR
jgi:ABC-type siderophore export system fused ATPase/permease subunit